MAAGAVLLLLLNRPRGSTAATDGTNDEAARRLFQGAAFLSVSVLADSALEHYRGRFHNPAMYIAPAVSAVTLGTAVHGALQPRRQDRLRTGTFAVALATGLIGLGFHAYNIGKREGGYGWLNLFYAAPLGAPAALSLTGVFGLAGGQVGTSDAASAKLLRLDAGEVLSGAAAVGLVGTTAEVALLHFRGAYQNPFMYVPVTIPPLAAAATATAAVRRDPVVIRTAATLLTVTALLGFAGPGFHSYGIHRNMGGWRNRSQMILQGPPLPAPLGFTGTAIAGLAALSLLRKEAR